MTATWYMTDLLTGARCPPIRGTNRRGEEGITGLAKSARRLVRASPAADGDVVDQDEFLAVGPVGGRRHLGQRLAVGANEPRTAGPACVGVLATGWVQPRVVQPGVVVQGGVDLHLGDPPLGAAPGRAELVPPGDGAARR